MKLTACQWKEQENYAFYLASGLVYELLSGKWAERHEIVIHKTDI
jgi:hypothetical protein